MENFTTLQLTFIALVIWALMAFFIAIGVYLFKESNSIDTTTAMIFFSPVWVSIYLVVALVSSCYTVLKNSFLLIIEP